MDPVEITVARCRLHGGIRLTCAAPGEVRLPRGRPLRLRFDHDLEEDGPGAYRLRMDARLDGRPLRSHCITLGGGRRRGSLDQDLVLGPGEHTILVRVVADHLARVAPGGSLRHARAPPQEMRVRVGGGRRTPGRGPWAAASSPRA